MGLADDEVALDEAEQEMFRHLQDLDSHLGQEDGEHEQEIGKCCRYCRLCDYLG